MTTRSDAYLSVIKCMIVNQESVKKSKFELLHGYTLSRVLVYDFKKGTNRL